MASGLVREMTDGTERSISRSESLADLLIQSLAGKVVALLENASPSNSLSDESITSRLQKAERKLGRLTDDSEDENDCWQSAQVGQIRTREDYYYEELRGSSLRVLL